MKTVVKIESVALLRLKRSRPEVVIELDEELPWWREFAWWLLGFEYLSGYAFIVYMQERQQRMDALLRFNNPRGDIG
jgi:hypothetical protein